MVAATMPRLLRRSSRSARCQWAACMSAITSACVPMSPTFKGSPGMPLPVYVIVGMFSSAGCRRPYRFQPNGMIR